MHVYITFPPAFHFSQGEEPEEFWSALDASPDQTGSHEPSSPIRGKKLIHCSINSSGNFIVDELDGFEQDVSAGDFRLGHRYNWDLRRYSVSPPQTFTSPLTAGSDWLPQDLNDNDVMLVDTGDEVYCWIGSDASAMEKEKAFQVAKVTLTITFQLYHTFEL